MEVKKTVEGLKEMGYRGVILGYAREVVLGTGEAEGDGKGDMGKAREELEAWRKGTVQTVRLVEKGDDVALKFVELFPSF